MKRILTILLSAIILVSAMSVPAFAEDTVNIKYGDANNDGKISLRDGSVMLQYLAGWDGIDIDLNAADCNHDGKVSLSDITRLLQYLVASRYPDFPDNWV